jgi:primosomal protein N' (replication factor Y)
MERKEGRYRAQLLFRSAQRAPLHEVLRVTLLDLRGAAEMRRARLSLDVDPLEL